MIREQSDPFVADAALGSLHAMLATLLFCLSYVLLAKRLRAFASVACSALIWMLAAAIGDQLPGGIFLALALFGIMLLFSRAYINSVGLSSKTASAPVRWGDLLVRGVLAGGVVCLATILLVNIDPAISGIVLSFPIGMLTIALTLHQRCLQILPFGFHCFYLFSLALSCGFVVGGRIVAKLFLSPDLYHN